MTIHVTIVVDEQKNFMYGFIGDRVPWDAAKFSVQVREWRKRRKRGRQGMADKPKGRGQGQGAVAGHEKGQDAAIDGTVEALTAAVDRIVALEAEVDALKAATGTDTGIPPGDDTGAPIA